MGDERVKFRTGRFVHWANPGWGGPTLCTRVMKWHDPIPTTDAVSCPTCLDIKPLPERKRGEKDG
jgi:hypothetical protein